MRKIGILGSSFNPIHIGHLIIAEQAYLRLQLDEILFIPTNKPYHKDVDLVDYVYRYEMANRIVIENNHFSISDIERNIIGNSYSYDIVNLLKDKEEAEYFFIIGSDSLLQIHTWYKYKEFLNLVNLIVFKRPGYDIDKNLIDNYKNMMQTKLYYYDDIQVEISSTDIRNSIKKDVYPRYILLDDTIKYIKDKRLWQ